MVNPRKSAVTAVTDPLEGARIVSPDAMPGESAAPTVEVVEDNRPEPVPPPVMSAKRAAYYRVAETKQLSWYGQTITVYAGDVLSDESYGPGAMDRMRDAGVALELADPPT